MCGKGPGQGHGWVVGGTRGWAGGSGSSVGAGRRWERVVGGSRNAPHQLEGDAPLMLEDDAP